MSRKQDRKVVPVRPATVRLKHEGSSIGSHTSRSTLIGGHPKNARWQPAAAEGNRRDTIKKGPHYRRLDAST